MKEGAPMTPIEGTTPRIVALAYLGNPHDHPLWQEVADELDRASSLFGRFNSGHEGWAVIAEELDELWDHVRGVCVELGVCAVKCILDRCIDFFGEDDLDPESSEAMRVVIKNRDVYALRAALASSIPVPASNVSEGLREAAGEDPHFAAWLASHRTGMHWGCHRDGAAECDVAYLAALAHAAPEGLDDGPWQQMSDAADPGPWTYDGDRLRSANRAIGDMRYAYNSANVKLIVAAVNYIRARLRQPDATEEAGR